MSYLHSPVPQGYSLCHRAFPKLEVVNPKAPYTQQNTQQKGSLGVHTTCTHLIAVAHVATPDDSNLPTHPGEDVGQGL